MRKKLILVVMLCGVLLLSGCIDASREQLRDSIRARLSEPESPGPRTDYSELEESWEKTGENAGNLWDDLTEFAGDIGSEIGDGVGGIVDDLGGAISSDMSGLFDSVSSKKTEEKKEKKEDGKRSDKSDKKEKSKDAEGQIRTASDIVSLLDGDLSFTQDAALEGPYRIAYVVDGDTVKLDGFGDTRFRLIGCDTPESVAQEEYLESSGKKNTAEGKDASAFMKEYLPKDTAVYIEYDAGHEDRYGRQLIYLYADKEDGLVFVNELLLMEGYAKIFTLQPNVKYADGVFIRAQEYARDNQKGFWGTGFFAEE